MFCPKCYNEISNGRIICSKCQYIPTLKDIIENYNVSVSFPLMQQREIVAQNEGVPMSGRALNISAERHVHTQLRKKYDYLADAAVEKFSSYLSQLTSLEELIGSVQDMFLLSIETSLNEISRDAISVGYYSLDTESIIAECIQGDYFNAFETAFSIYTAAELKISGDLSQSTTNRTVRKQYRSRWTSATYNGTMLDAWGNQLKAGTMNAIEGAGHSVVNFIGNAVDTANAEESRRVVFRNQKLRSQLIQGVWSSCSNLRRVIDNTVSKKCKLSLGGGITDKDVKTAQGIYNNIMNLNLSENQQCEFVFKVLSLNPYQPDYYLGFLEKFPEYSGQFMKIARFFGIKGLEKKLEAILVNYVKLHLGSTEDDAYRCRELTKEQAAQLGLQEGEGTEAYALIDQQLETLDLEYRTVSGTVFETRNAADAARKDLETYSDILSNSPEFVFRSDYLSHIEAIKALPMDSNLLSEYVKQYENQLVTFDEKCKKAARYDHFLKNNNRFWNGDAANMIFAYLVLGFCLLTSVLSLMSDEARFGGFMWFLISACYFAYMVSGRITKNKKEWEEVTHNGQYPYVDIVGKNGGALKSKSAICIHCGEKNLASAQFCVSCGRSVNGKNRSKKRKAKKKPVMANVIGGMITVVIVIGIFFAVVINISRKYEIVVQDFETAMNECNGEALYRTMTTGAMIKAFEEQLDSENYADGWYQNWILSQVDEHMQESYGEGIFKTVEDYYDELSEATKSLKEYLRREFGGEVTYSIEILGEEEMYQSQINRIAHYYQKMNAPLDSDDIVEAYTLDVLFTVTGKDGSVSYPVKMDVVRVKVYGWMISEEFLKLLFSDETLINFSQNQIGEDDETITEETTEKFVTSSTVEEVILETEPPADIPVKLTFAEEYVHAIIESEDLWLAPLNGVGYGYNECWFQDLDMDGIPEFIVGGRAEGNHAGIFFNVYSYRDGQLLPMEDEYGEQEIGFWGTDGFDCKLYKNENTNSFVYLYSTADGTASYEDYSVRELVKTEGIMLYSIDVLKIRWTSEGYIYQPEYTAEYDVIGTMTREEMLEHYDTFFASMTPYQTYIKTIPCTDLSCGMEGHYDYLSDEEKKQLLIESYETWGYEEGSVAKLPLADIIAEIRMLENKTETFSNSDLGKMYNLFHFRTLALPTEGCLYDVNGDGVEELILWGYGDCYCVYTFQNGDLNVSYDYSGESIVDGKILTHQQISSACREKAAENGYTMNQDFFEDSIYIGYIDTEGGELNLRADAAQDAEIITKIPYGTFFNLYQEEMSDYFENSEWYYIGIKVDGEMYYGYISGEYAHVVDLGI